MFTHGKMILTFAIMIKISQIHITSSLIPHHSQFMHGAMDPENCQVNQVLCNQNSGDGFETHMLMTRHHAHTSFAQNKRRFLLDDPQV